MKRKKVSISKKVQDPQSLPEKDQAIKETMVRDLQGHLVGFKKYGPRYAELFDYFNRYQSEGIAFPFFETPRHVFTKADIAAMAGEWSLSKQRIKELKARIGFMVSYESDITPNQVIDPVLIERFYARRYEQRKHLYLNDEPSFIEHEAEVLKEKFTGMDREFETKFVPFLSFLNKAKCAGKIEFQTVMTKTLKEIFTVENYAFYVNALCRCEPAILREEEGQWEFIGNVKTERGIVGQWFKFLKSIGVVSPSLNRDALAKILSSEIKNFSISGSNLDNVTDRFTKKFQRQLEALIKINT
jgi:hypothetical protein